MAWAFTLIAQEMWMGKKRSKMDSSTSRIVPAVIRIWWNSSYWLVWNMLYLHALAIHLLWVKSRKFSATGFFFRRCFFFWRLCRIFVYVLGILSPLESFPQTRVKHNVKVKCKKHLPSSEKKRHQDTYAFLESRLVKWFICQNTQFMQMEMLCYSGLR